MRALLVLNTLLALCIVSFGQTNPQNVPRPPKAELQEFEPFLGIYQVSQLTSATQLTTAKPADAAHDAVNTASPPRNAEPCKSV